jgi:hypothetical protein
MDMLIGYARVSTVDQTLGCVGRVISDIVKG